MLCSLDVLRTFRKLPAAIEMLQQEFYPVRGQNRLFDRAWRQLQQRLKNPKEEQGRALTQQLFDLCCASQLLRFASPPLADAWCRMTLITVINICCRKWFARYCPVAASGFQ